MKRIAIISIFAAALTLASSCNRDEAGLDPSGQYRTVTLTADAARTKTVLDGDAVKWEDGDEVALRFTHDTKAAVVEKFTTELEGPSFSADFTGGVNLEVLVEEGGFHDEVIAVYPSSALAEDGTLSFLLPAAQKARDNGGFAPSVNLSSAALTLTDIRDDGKASATFRNALSILRFSVKGDDVVSVTLEGTSPLAGSAPLELSSADGRLVVDGDAQWAEADKSMSVTLTPADGSECFVEGEVYNLLIWPGTHESLTATLNFKDYGGFSKASANEFTFDASKFYSLDFNMDSETLVTEITSGIGSVEDQLQENDDKLGDLEDAAGNLSALLDRIQSVALVSEYLDNSVYARYATFQYSKEYLDIELDYLVRPASAAAELVEVFADVMSAKMYPTGSASGGFTTLAVKDASLNGDIMTVKVDASAIPASFYAGTSGARLALQISDGNTEILSDFANLVPKEGASMRLSYDKDVIPVIKGSTVRMSFSYAIPSDYTASSYKFIVEGNGSVQNTHDTRSGNLYFNISDSEPVESQSARFLMKTTDGEIVYSRDFTFKEDGVFKVTSSPAAVDCYGGYITVYVTENTYDNYAKESSGFLSEVSSSSGETTYSVDENTGAERSSSVRFTITNGALQYTYYYNVVQRATGTAPVNYYYYDGRYQKMQTARTDIAKPLNLVILGDGYKMKDLAAGSKFEKAAWTAAGHFFNVEPFASFKDRFNIYMVGYASNEEGTDVKVSNIEKDTYFNTVCQGGGNTAVSCDYDKVIEAVGKLGITRDNYDIYRTVVIVLINTDETSGSCWYVKNDAEKNASIDLSQIGDGYASISVAMFAANNPTVGDLLRHEAGGHGFGRLGDEYTSGNGTATEETKANLEAEHQNGYYLNLSSTNGADSPWADLVGYDGTGYYEGAWGYNYGIYRPSESSIMLNNVGRFNAPSRRAIYRRIILQTEGAIYTDEQLNTMFKDYDKKNL